MMKRLTRAGGVVAVALTLTSCLDPLGSDFDCSGFPGLRIFVRDAVTLDYKAAGATVRAIAGSSTETYVVPSVADMDSLPVALGLIRPASYTLEVTRAGYQPWSRSGVRLSVDCFEPLQIHEARLQPNPPAVSSAVPLPASGR